ncbi:ABC transporter substrate-binding protein [Miltoncostaea marina]|uniref:ABC transporter substrate-binding protein n=1 Tax=Miltoncostaea marina TaxID=2843215 RepID=UPI001C3C803C|nr:ABC transporter substrate-binding protein [Miltoncostaea marina]
MIRAAAALALTGRYGPLGRQAAAGLRAWAAAAGVRLRLEDDRSDPERSGRLTAALASSADLLFGPYGSGPGRAAARAMAGRPEVVWNHGAAEVPRTGARVVDVIGPAGSYWRGLPAALAAAEGGGEPVALVRAPGGFGAAVAAGARRALAAAGRPPVAELALAPADPGAAVAGALAAGAGWVAGGGRMEDDLALARAAAGAGLRAALVVCGVAALGEELGERAAGWLGPVAWDGVATGPVAPPAGCDYPAAQAIGAGCVALEALRAAGSAAPDALWAAARALRTRTIIGPFAVDAEGRQVAHSPSIVRWERAAGGVRRVVVWRPPPPGP